MLVLRYVYSVSKKMRWKVAWTTFVWTALYIEVRIVGLG